MVILTEFREFSVDSFQQYYTAYSYINFSELFSILFKAVHQIPILNMTEFFMSFSCILNLETEFGNFLLTNFFHVQY